MVRQRARLDRPHDGDLAGDHLAQAGEQLARDRAWRTSRAEARDERLELAHLLEPAPGARLHRRGAACHEALARHRDPVLAEPLRLVQRGIGRLHQRAEIGAVVGGARDAEAQGEPPAAEVERLECPLEAPADGARVRAARRRQQQRELLAAEPEHGVARTHAAAKDSGDRAQRVIARHVAAPVVQLLEVVEVGQHERELHLGRGLDQRQGRLVEAPVVPEARQAVGHRGALRTLEHAQRRERGRGVRDEQLGLLERLGLDLDAAARARDEEPEQLVPRPHGQADDLAATLERGVGRELAVPALRAQAERLSPGAGDEGVDGGVRQRVQALTPRVARRDDDELVVALGRLDTVDVEHLAHETRGELEERMAVARAREAQERAAQPARPGGPLELARRQGGERLLDDARHVVGRFTDRRVERSRVTRGRSHPGSARSRTATRRASRPRLRGAPSAGPMPHR